jgi:protein-tyrosine phosphatase
VIDLHTHVVSGYDDGATDGAESVAMARLWAADGVTTVAATPHVGAWSWGPAPVDLPERCAGLNAHFAKEGLAVEIVPGAEVYLTADSIRLLASREAGHRPLGESHYVLVEFSLGGVSAPPDDAFFGLQMAGWRPILAHAERYQAFQRKPERLGELLGRGVLAQVTAGSLLGEFGSRAKDLAEELVRLDLCAMVSSDAHHAYVRRPRMGEARARLVALVGESGADRLCRANAAVVLADEPLEVDGDPSRLRAAQRSFLGVLGL